MANTARLSGARGVDAFASAASVNAGAVPGAAVDVASLPSAFVARVIVTRFAVSGARRPRTTDIIVAIDVDFGPVVVVVVNTARLTDVFPDCARA